MTAAIHETQTTEIGLLGSLLTDDTFWPAETDSLAETGLSDSFVEGLILKSILAVGALSGRNLSEHMGLPFKLVDPILDSMRSRKLITHVRPAPFNDYFYSLTELGQNRAQIQIKQCSYIGPAPVPLSDYVLSVEAQAVGLDPVTQEQLQHALEKISYESDLLDFLGPAINSNAGLFLFGEPGNGKTTLARCLSECHGQDIWIPHAILDDGNLIKLHDDAFHHASSGNDSEGSMLKDQPWDRRWIRVKRPTVIVGGELMLDHLEVRHDARSNICEAPLQMKSNGGCLLIDDFGRQRIAPEELLNRWIVPLENKHDFLTLPTGKKIQIPFEQMLIFSTNLDPADLVDEAFLRRVPYKIFVGDPSANEYRQLMHSVAKQMGFPETPEAAEYMLAFYKKTGRRPRRCHPRDLLKQVASFCRYRQLPLGIQPASLQRACQSYFSHL